MQYTKVQKLTLENSDFRRFLFTNRHSQVVLMSVRTGEDIGQEVHDVDEVLFFVRGSGEALVGGETQSVGAGDMVAV